MPVSIARPLSVSVFAPLSRIVRNEAPDGHGLHCLVNDANRVVVNAGRDAEQNYALLCAELCRRLFHHLPRGKLFVPLGFVFGGRLGDPWTRRGDRGSGFARALGFGVDVFIVETVMKPTGKPGKPPDAIFKARKLDDAELAEHEGFMKAAEEALRAVREAMTAPPALQAPVETPPTLKSQT